MDHALDPWEAALWHQGSEGTEIMSRIPYRCQPITTASNIHCQETRAGRGDEQKATWRETLGCGACWPGLSGM